MAWPLKYKAQFICFLPKSNHYYLWESYIRILKKAKDKKLSLFCVCLVIMEICLQGKKT